MIRGGHETRGRSAGDAAGTYADKFAEQTTHKVCIARRMGEE